MTFTQLLNSDKTSMVRLVLHWSTFLSVTSLRYNRTGRKTPSYLPLRHTTAGAQSEAVMIIVCALGIQDTAGVNGTA